SRRPCSQVGVPLSSPVPPASTRHKHRLHSMAGRGSCSRSRRRPQSTISPQSSERATESWSVTTSDSTSRSSNWCASSMTDGWVAEVELDYVSRRYRRGIEIVGTEATARFDWARNVIELEDGDGCEAWPATAAVEASYVREAERFLAFVEHGTPPPVGGAEGCESVRLAEAIRAAAR